jgi:hypothetical protein
MSGAVCQACGVPVVPGYVRCPKCHAPLPRVTFRRAGNTIDPGGTAVAGPSRSPLILLIVGGVLAIALLAYLGLRGGKKDKPVTAEPQPQQVGSEVAGAASGPGVVEPPVQNGSTAPAAPSPDSIAASFERALKKQRLWSTVEVIGSRADVRSGSCSEPGMTTALDGVAASFKAAGLTRLRCLEQSGRVVISRDL